MKKVYYGNLDNHENKRPSIHEPAAVYTTGTTSKQEYELINILVHGGKYDSYILKNRKTGKIKNASIIYRIK